MPNKPKNKFIRTMRDLTGVACLIVGINFLFSKSIILGIIFILFAIGIYYNLKD